MPRALMLLGLLLAHGACRRAQAPASVVDDVPAVLAPGAPPPPTGTCRAAQVQWAARPAAGERFDDEGGVRSDAGADNALFPRIESAALARDADGDAWTLWLDAQSSALTLARPGAHPTATAAAGAGDRGPALLALSNGVPVVAWAHETRAGRVHSLRHGPALERGCEQPEGRDEGLALALTATTRGALLAWDELAPGANTTVIQVQSVALPAPAGRCGATHQVSPSDQDASDPALAPAPDGGAVVFWLSSRELEPGQYNDTVTDVWGLALDAAGLPRGAPARVTTTSGHRFGLSAAVSPDGASAWIAWRAVPDSGTEARGDGGVVALARVTRNAAGLGRASDAVILTEAGAVPTGSPRVFPRATRDAPVEVWWRERRDGAVQSWRRAVGPTLRPAAASPEPRLHGELPAWLDPRGAGLLALVRTPGGGVARVRYRCDP